MLRLGAYTHANSSGVRGLKEYYYFFIQVAFSYQSGPECAYGKRDCGGLRPFTV